MLGENRSKGRKGLTQKDFIFIIEVQNNYYRYTINKS